MRYTEAMTNTQQIGNGVTVYRNTESWGPLAVLTAVDGVGVSVEKFDSVAAVDAYWQGVTA